MYHDLYFGGPGRVLHSELLEAGVAQGRELRSSSGSLLVLVAKGKVALVGLALNAVQRKVL